VSEHCRLNDAWGLFWEALLDAEGFRTLAFMLHSFLREPRLRMDVRGDVAVSLAEEDITWRGRDRER
jgi:hypothetical protein